MIEGSLIQRPGASQRRARGATSALRVRALHFVSAALGVVALLAAPASPESVKQIDPTNIEGEVHLPQVLFITSRESVRPLEFLDSYADLATQTLLDSIELPGAIWVIPPDDESRFLTDAGRSAPHTPSNPAPEVIATQGISARWKDEVSAQSKEAAVDGGEGSIDPTDAREEAPQPSVSPSGAETNAHISQRED